MNRCVFCGEILNEEGICPNMNQHFKPMCLNCDFFDSERCFCLNEENEKDAEQKIRQNCDFGYEITNLTLSPLPLKDPTKKCKRHFLNSDKLISQIKNT
jgi:hypothetical protein